MSGGSPHRIDFLAVVSRPDFPSGSGPVGDYFALRSLVARHPEWNAAVIELSARPTEVTWDGDRLVIVQDGAPPVDTRNVGTAVYVPICLEIEETLLSRPVSRRWPRFDTEQWRPISALFEHHLDEGTCINHPSAVRRANNKLLQHELLRQSGFALPPTSLGRAFPLAGPAAGPLLVAKNVSEGGWRSATEFSPAHLAGPNDPVEDWPVIWQEPLHSDTELRLYVMGDEVTAVELQRDHDEIDVRATNDGRPTGRFVDIRPQWAQLVMAMTRRLGLDYSVVDAIPVGDTLHVLEVNANGVWWFLPGDVGTELQSRFHRWIESWVTSTSS